MRQTWRKAWNPQLKNKSIILDADRNNYLPAAFQRKEPQTCEQGQSMIYLVISDHTPPSNGRVLFILSQILRS